MYINNETPTHSRLPTQSASPIPSHCPPVPAPRHAPRYHTHSLSTRSSRHRSGAVVAQRNARPHPDALFAQVRRARIPENVPPGERGSRFGLTRAARTLTGQRSRTDAHPWFACGGVPDVDVFFHTQSACACVVRTGGRICARVCGRGGLRWVVVWSCGRSRTRRDVQCDGLLEGELMFGTGRSSGCSLPCCAKTAVSRTSDRMQRTAGVSCSIPRRVSASHQMQSTVNASYSMQRKTASPNAATLRPAQRHKHNHNPPGALINTDTHNHHTTSPPSPWPK